MLLRRSKPNLHSTKATIQLATLGLEILRIGILFLELFHAQPNLLEPVFEAGTPPALPGPILRPRKLVHLTPMGSHDGSQMVREMRLKPLAVTVEALRLDTMLAGEGTEHPLLRGPLPEVRTKGALHHPRSREHQTVERGRGDVRIVEHGEGRRNVCGDRG